MPLNAALITMPLNAALITMPLNAALIIMLLNAALFIMLLNAALTILPLNAALMTTKKDDNEKAHQLPSVFTVAPALAGGLMRIEAVKQAIQTLPVTPRVLANLRETARLFSTHYSTMIEGNRLTRQPITPLEGAEALPIARPAGAIFHDPQPIRFPVGSPRRRPPTISVRSSNPVPGSSVRSPDTPQIPQDSGRLSTRSGRNGDAGFARFCSIAMGSASELEYHLLSARDSNCSNPRTTTISANEPS
jgi:hypothetical protein